MKKGSTPGETGALAALVGAEWVTGGLAGGVTAAVLAGEGLAVWEAGGVGPSGCAVVTAVADAGLRKFSKGPAFSGGTGGTSGTG